MSETLGSAGHYDDEASSTASRLPTGSDSSAIRLGLPMLDEVSLCLRERTDTAHTVRLD
jgi:hypothetical protein